MHPKDLDGRANNVDPVQTASLRSSLIWVCTVIQICLSQYLDTLQSYICIVIGKILCRQTKHSIVWLVTVFTVHGYAKTSLASHGSFIIRL